MEINAMTRYEKLEYLLETCSESFIKECTMLHEMTRWMEEDDFSAFFTHLCSQWEIKDPTEEDEEDEMNEFTVEDDEMVFTA